MTSGQTEMNTSEIGEILRNLPKFGNGTGLHRMSALCESLFQSEWMSNLDAIRITGSNGKGSASAMIAAILKELDISTGLYTSPHLVRFNERIVVNGVPIADSELARAVRWFGVSRDKYLHDFPADTIGAFEAFTAIALKHFHDEKPQTVVSEAGIGGRFDSTRIIPGRIVGLTSVDLEHTELLGSTLEAIAFDKADLCQPGGTLVTGIADPELLRRLRVYCGLNDIIVHSVSENSSARNISFGETGMTANLVVDSLELPGLKIALQGTHHIGNVQLSISIVRQWLRKNRPSVTDDQLKAAVYRGLGAVKWKGRFERIHRDPDVFIDVGHTPAAIASLVDTVRNALQGKRILLVTGVSFDKNVEAIVSELVTIADAVVCTRAHHKGTPPDEIHRIVTKQDAGVEIFSRAAIEEAISFALGHARESDMTILVAGGLFLAIEASQVIAGKDPRELRFF